jgi:cardiolipin synthase C
MTTLTSALPEFSTEWRAVLRRFVGILPTLEGRTESHALEDTTGTRLHAALAPMIDAHPGLSGVFELHDGRDAFAARVLLCEAAERTLDLQYYIWRNDMSGTRVFEAVKNAADRGVRVRLLLDDNNTGGLDPWIGALDSHPLIEVRLFNPFVMRRWRWRNYLGDFPRLNRRMHNKSFTADNLVTIVGGRNMSDEYFEAHAKVSFVDLDVLATGPVVREVSKSFDEYWESESSYPAERIIGRATKMAVKRTAKMARAALSEPKAVAYANALASCFLVQDLLAGKMRFHWAKTRMMADDPAKALDRARLRDTLPERLRVALGSPQRELLLVSPYLVPTSSGVSEFMRLGHAGVTIRILTNALEATDVAIVHAGYAKRRRRLLEAGVTLFELRRTTPRRTRRERRMRRDRRLTGSSGSSLHAKTFAIDGNRVFIGSLNFDPRSARLNTEIGFLIDSPKLAQTLADWFEDEVPARAYRVELDRHHRLRWVAMDDEEVIYYAEPGTSVWQRAGVALLALLPIEWML